MPPLVRPASTVCPRSHPAQSLPCVLPLIWKGQFSNFMCREVDPWILHPDPVGLSGPKNLFKLLSWRPLRHTLLKRRWPRGQKILSAEGGTLGGLPVVMQRGLTSQ